MCYDLKLRMYSDAIPQPGLLVRQNFLIEIKETRFYSMGWVKFVSLGHLLSLWEGGSGGVASPAPLPVPFVHCTLFD